MNDSKKFRKSVRFQIYDAKTMGGLQQKRLEMSDKFDSLSKIEELSPMPKPKRMYGRFGRRGLCPEEADSTTRYMLAKLFTVLNESRIVFHSRLKVVAYEHLQSRAGQVGLIIYRV